MRTTPESGNIDEDDRNNRLAAIGEIAAGMAHELRNSLQIVSANVHLAQQNPATSQPFLARIERSARVAHGIVDDLMALARGEPAHAEQVAFTDLLPVARELLPDPGAEFDDTRIPADLQVRVHPGLASRLLHVLFENAIHAAAPKRPIIVTRASRSETLVVIDIADDGPGVPSEIAATLFDPLVTARASGTGLGLALARRIADAHGGTIALVSSSVGATFRLSLPT